MKLPLFSMVALSCVLLGSTAVRADVPSSADDFVRAFNSGNAASIAAYMQAHVVQPPPGMREGGDRTRDLLQLRSAIGSVTLHGVRDLPRRAVATVKAKGGWYDFVFLKAPPGTGSSEFIDVSAALAPPPKRPEQSTDAYLRSIAAAGYFSGAVLVAKPGSAPFVAAYGLADRATRSPNVPDTQFNIASIGKLFTTAAIYQLVEAGTLHLTDTIGRWLPDYPNADAKAATVQQLLDMTSGIGDIFNERFMRADHTRIRSLQDYLPFFAADPLGFKPGTGKAYSNGGYIVLGLIIEKAAGESFYSYVQKHIFAPAGMSRTAYLSLDDPSPGRALGYTRGPTDVPTWSMPLRPSAALEPARGSSAGGAYSTVGDLYKFAQAARDGRLVKGQYAWNVSPSFLGGAPGWNSVLSVRDGVTTIVLSNQDPPMAQNLADILVPIP